MTLANTVRTFKAAIWQLGSVRLLAHLKADDGTDVDDIVQADLSSISYTIYGTNRVVVSGPTALTVASVITDTLQEGDVWEADGDGYNFDTTLAASLFATAITYVVSIKFTMTNGRVFYCEFQLTAQPT